jgi:hypothetical protein
VTDFPDFDSTASDTPIPEEIQEWVTRCENILDDCDDVPERAEDFAVSVSEKIESMAQWIADNRRITPAMIEAIENMDQALQKVRGNA